MHPAVFFSEPPEFLVNNLTLAGVVDNFISDFAFPSNGFLSLQNEVVQTNFCTSLVLSSRFNLLKVILLCILFCVFQHASDWSFLLKHCDAATHRSAATSRQTRVTESVTVQMATTKFRKNRALVQEEASLTTPVKTAGHACRTRLDRIHVNACQDTPERCAKLTMVR